MALRRLTLAALGSAAVMWTPIVAAETQTSDPNLMHGLGQVVGGVLFELPKTVLDATLAGPPIAGTIVGLFAGTARALQVTVAGLVEVSQGFDPWGAKKRAP